MAVQAPPLFTFPEVAYTSSFNSIASISAVSAPSAGCGSGLPTNLTSGAKSINITISSPLSSPNETLQERKYRIFLPSSFPTANNDPRPLLLTFNGQFQPTSSIENYTLFSDPAFNENAIAVYPEGIDNQWLGDPAAPPSTSVNDVQFVSDVLDDLESKLCIDTNRMYGAGFSNGGGLTALLACNETVGSRFAAFAGVAGAYYSDHALSEPLFGSGCTRDANTTVPYLEIHGEEDMIIAYNGSNADAPDTFPVDVYVSKLADLNGCGTTVVAPGGIYDVYTNSTQVLNSADITKYSWTCSGVEDVVVHYKVKGLGHGWPSSVYYGGILDEYRLGPTNWNASAVIGEWFGRWSKRSAWQQVL